MAKVKITGHASGTGVFTLTAPNSNTDRTITLPDADVTLGTDATKLPLAGGTMTGDIILNDNVSLKIGTGDDFRIYHDGSNTYLDEQNQGDLAIRSNGTKITLNRIADGHEGLVYTLGGSIKLKHNNNTKIETTAAGVTVTGAIGGATNLGKVLQILHYSSSSLVTFPQNSSNNTTIVSGAITPSASNSKILTIQYLDLGLQGGNYPALHSKLDRSGGTLTSGNLHGYMDTQNFDRRFAYTKIHLDSPNTTSATTYTVYGGNTSGSGFSGTYNGRANVSAPSTLTLIEIGA